MEPKAIGSPPDVFKIAMEFLNKVDSKKVLDCPAGEGLFSRLCIDSGLVVVSGDIDPEQYMIKENKCDFIDLNKQLPYDDDSFDAVACLNGFQRIWARGRAISEFARILKSGGYLIISFPNNGDIRRRTLFFLTGSVTWNTIGPPHICIPGSDNPASCFRYPITLPNVLSSVSSVGLEVASIRSTHYSKGALLLCPLIIGPLLFTFFSPRKYKHVFDKNLYWLKKSSSLDALLGAFLVVISRKITN